MIEEKDKNKLIKKIVLERIRNMAPNVKIALGSKGKFLGKKIVKKAAGDVLTRSLVRHDSGKLAKAILKICKSELS